MGTELEGPYKVIYEGLLEVEALREFKEKHS